MYLYTYMPKETYMRGSPTVDTMLHKTIMRSNTTTTTTTTLCQHQKMPANVPAESYHILCSVPAHSTLVNCNSWSFCAEWVCLCSPTLGMRHVPAKEKIWADLVVWAGLFGPTGGSSKPLSIDEEHFTRRPTREDIPQPSC
jgi:hypothetical protein